MRDIPDGGWFWATRHAGQTSQAADDRGAALPELISPRARTGEASRATQRQSRRVNRQQLLHADAVDGQVVAGGGGVEIARRAGLADDVALDG